VCGSSDVSITVSTSSASYSAGQTVTIPTTITNKSSHPCQGNYLLPTLSIQDSNGKEVARETSGMAAQASGEATWQAGQTFSYTFYWDQTSGGARAPSGSYTAVVRWNTLYPPHNTTFSLQ
jgi:hypothetical protein